MAKDRRAILTIRGRCLCPDANAGGRSYVSFYLTADQKRTGSKPPSCRTATTPEAAITGTGVTIGSAPWASSTICWPTKLVALDFCCLRQREGVVNVHAKISHCVLDFAVAEEDLDGSQIARGFVD
jgi:hypothetical protein